MKDPRPPRVFAVFFFLTVFWLLVVQGIVALFHVWFG